MAKNSLLTSESSKLSESDSIKLTSGKNMVAAFKKFDAAGLKKWIDNLNADYAVLTDGAALNKRFHGAASHGFADQLTAYSNTVIRGNIPRAE
jgi:hypothetical protein